MTTDITCPIARWSSNEQLASLQLAAMAQIIHVGSGSGEKRSNVIFLHGLGGDPRTTWQSTPDDQSFWPRWLVEDVAGLSVYSIGYEASVSLWDGTAMHLTDRANNVLSRILAESELQTGQLILIGHSLGGLVIKQLLRTAESKARYDADAAIRFSVVTAEARSSSRGPYQSFVPK